MNEPSCNQAYPIKGDVLAREKILKTYSLKRKRERHNREFAESFFFSIKFNARYSGSKHVDKCTKNYLYFKCFDCNVVW